MCAAWIRIGRWKVQLIPFLLQNGCVCLTAAWSDPGLHVLQVLSSSPSSRSSAMLCMCLRNGSQRWTLAQPSSTLILNFFTTSPPFHYFSTCGINAPPLFFFLFRFVFFLVLWWGTFQRMLSRFCVHSGNSFFKMAQNLDLRCVLPQHQKHVLGFDSKTRLASSIKNN